MQRVIEKLKYEENQKLRKFVAEKVLEQCEKEPAFIDKVLNEDKTLDDCIAYITSLAKKEADDGCATIEDNTVRGWAIHYFDEAELEDWKSLSQKAKESKEREEQRNKTIKTKKHEDEEEDAKEEIEEEVIPIEPKPKKSKKVAEGQLSLFEW